MSDVLPFVEAFGPTLQGEGPAAGRLAAFLRFGGCNLSCSWCDSAYTWDASRYTLREEIHNLTVGQILDRTPIAPLTVVTGGEPLLNQQRPQFHQLLDALGVRGQIHVETNGTIPPNDQLIDRVDQFMVSPKLGNAGDHKPSQNPALSPLWATVHDRAEAHMKVVVETPADVERAVNMADAAGWPMGRVWVMPEGTTARVLNDRWPWVATEATRWGINATHRLHVLSWGDERGH